MLIHFTRVARTGRILIGASIDLDYLLDQYRAKYGAVELLAAIEGTREDMRAIRARFEHCRHCRASTSPGRESGKAAGPRDFVPRPELLEFIAGLPRNPALVTGHRVTRMSLDPERMAEKIRRILSPRQISLVVERLTEHAGSPASDHI